MTIIGDGTVGRALAKVLKIGALGHSDDSIEDDIVFICVPTPTIDGKQDLSAVEQAVSRVKNAQLIVIRSTVLPGTTDRLQSENNIPIMFLPEFGKEKTMEEDLTHPEYYVYGTTERSKPYAGIVFDVLPRAPMTNVSAKSAEFIKYFSNIWRAGQVMMANTLYDWVMSQDGNEIMYQQVIGGLLHLSDIPKYGWKVMSDGKRGYAGKCLPKDFKAAIGQYPNELWQVIDKYNEKLLHDKEDLDKLRNKIERTD